MSPCARGTTWFRSLEFARWLQTLDDAAGDAGAPDAQKGGTSRKVPPRWFPRYAHRMEQSADTLSTRLAQLYRQGTESWPQARFECSFQGHIRVNCPHLCDKWPQNMANTKCNKRLTARVATAHGN